MAPRMSDKLRASRPSSQYILSLRFANRRFSPTMFGSLLTMVGVALFSLLGVWQLDRAEEKRALLAQFAAGQQSTVAVTAESASSLPRYQHVQARGRYDPQHQILLDNMPSESGRAGYRVLTPLALEAGGWLLVDRGWIAPGATRDALPSIAVGAELRSIVGRLDRLPEPGMRLGEDSADPGAGWPRVLNFPQHEQLERVLHRSLARGDRAARFCAGRRLRTGLASDLSRRARAASRLRRAMVRVCARRRRHLRHHCPEAAGNLKCPHQSNQHRAAHGRWSGCLSRFSLRRS